jgi:hypothetical protein
VPEQGGINRTILLPDIPEHGDVDIASARLGLRGEALTESIGKRVDQLHKRADDVLQYLTNEREAIAAAYDELARRSNELPEFVQLDFFQDNVAASQTAVALSNGMTTRGYCAVEDGSVTAVAVRTNDPRTAGTLTLEAFINGVATGLTVTLDATNTTSNQVRQDQGLDTFMRGDAIDLRITTTGSWTPITADIICSVGIVTMRGVR